MVSISGTPYPLQELDMGDTCGDRPMRQPLDSSTRIYRALNKNLPRRVAGEALAWRQLSSHCRTIETVKLARRYIQENSTQLELESRVSFRSPRALTIGVGPSPTYFPGAGAFA